MAAIGNVEFNTAELWYGSDGPMMILHVPFQTAAKGTIERLDPEKTYVAEIKEKKPKRSLNANSYMWALLDQLAIVLRTSKEVLYKDYIQKYGIFKDYPPLPPSDAETLKYVWREMGTGWIAEQVDYAPDGENVIIRCYYGSSKYNTKQMSRLIDHIVEDCKEQGIETLDERELSLLKENWEAKK